MRRFSLGTSLGDAFGLIHRRPMAVFVWGLLLVLPLFAAMALMFPAMGSMAEFSAEAEASDTIPPGFMAHMMQFQLGSMLANFGQLLLMAVVYTAIMRSVLRPEERSWCSLRIGMDELRVAVVGLVVGVGMYIVIMMLVLVGVAVGLAAWGSGLEPGPGVALAVGLALVLILALCWGLARVSLMAPATVLYRDFAFSQGWRLAAGKAWPLLGMMLLIALILLAFEAVLVLAGVLIAVATVGSGAGEGWSAGAAENPFPYVEAWLSANWHWVALGGAVAAIFYGVVLTLSVAPFASACRQLADSDRHGDASRRPPPDNIPRDSRRT